MDAPADAEPVAAPKPPETVGEALIATLGVDMLAGVVGLKGGAVDVPTPDGKTQPMACLVFDFRGPNGVATKVALVMEPAAMRKMGRNLMSTANAGVNEAERIADEREAWRARR